jgi:hypothetical protein
MRTGCFIFFFFLVHFFSNACECPHTELSLRECDKYELIFKGKVLSVKNCGDRPGEAIFEVQDLYKGNATKGFKIIFDCKGECALGFNAGEEWIIYTSYKQIDNAKMDWCSRSRKHFSNDKEDFYLVNYGNDFYEEEKFLKEKLGLHRLLSEKKIQNTSRNERPNTTQMIYILMFSIAAIVLFYYLFNKIFR